MGFVHVQILFHKQIRWAQGTLLHTFLEQISPPGAQTFSAKARHDGPRCFCGGGYRLEPPAHGRRSSEGTVCRSRRASVPIDWAMLSKEFCSSRQRFERGSCKLSESLQLPDPVDCRHLCACAELGEPYRAARLMLRVLDQASCSLPVPSTCSASVYTYICIYTRTYTHIYIYIYTHT